MRVEKPFISLTSVRTSRSDWESTRFDSVTRTSTRHEPCRHRLGRASIASVQRCFDAYIHTYAAHGVPHTKPHTNGSTRGFAASAASLQVECQRINMEILFRVRRCVGVCSTTNTCSSAACATTWNNAHRTLERVIQS